MRVSTPTTAMMTLVMMTVQLLQVIFLNLQFFFNGLRIILFQTFLKMGKSALKKTILQIGILRQFMMSTLMKIVNCSWVDKL